MRRRKPLELACTVILGTRVFNIQTPITVIFRITVVVLVMKAAQRSCLLI